MKRLIALALIVLSLVPALQTRAAAGGSSVHAAVPPELTVLIGLGQFEVSQGSQLSYAPKYLDVTVGDTVAWREIDQLDPLGISFLTLASVAPETQK